MQPLRIPVCQRFQVEVYQLFIDYTWFTMPFGAERRYDVFLSHNSHDKLVVEDLARRLGDVGVAAFLDKWHLIPGEPWQEALEEALDESSTCAIFLGPNGLGPWQNEEMRSALAERVHSPDFRMIPVLLPGASMPEREELPRFLRRLTWVDFRSDLDFEGALQRLIAGILGVAPGAVDGFPVHERPPPTEPTESSKAVKEAPKWTWWVVGIAVPLVVAMIGGRFNDWGSKPNILSPDGVYRVRVTVLDVRQVPVEDAKVWSSFGGETKQLAGGWEFNIPAGSKPQNGQLIVYAERRFQTGQRSVELREDSNVAVEIQLKKRLASVRGVVLGPSQHALAGALVSVLGYGDESVTTAEDGVFVLPAHAAAGEEVRLHVEHSDFLPTDQYHPAGNTPATVVLRSP